MPEPDRPAAPSSMPVVVDIEDDDLRALVVDALVGHADRLSRAATKAAGELDAEFRQTKRDVRSSAVAIARLLAQAARLNRVAARVEDAPTARVVGPVEAPASAGVAGSPSPTTPAAPPPGRPAERVELDVDEPGPEFADDQPTAAPAAVPVVVPAQVEGGAPVRTPEEARREALAAAMGVLPTIEVVPGSGDDGDEPEFREAGAGDPTALPEDNPPPGEAVADPNAVLVDVLALPDTLETTP